MFIRWGRSVCPSRTGAELVYEGIFLNFRKSIVTKEGVNLYIVVIVLNISVQPKYKEQ